MMMDEQTQKPKIFFEDFSSNHICPRRWLIARKQWGGDNGGVVEGSTN
jgi:hypothetical protein